MMKVLCGELETYEYDSQEIKLEAKFDSPQDVPNDDGFGPVYRLKNRGFIP